MKRKKSEMSVLKFRALSFERRTELFLICIFFNVKLTEKIVDKQFLH